MFMNQKKPEANADACTLYYAAFSSSASLCTHSYRQSSSVTQAQQVAT